MSALTRKAIIMNDPILRIKMQQVMREEAQYIRTGMADDTYQVTPLTGPPFTPDASRKSYHIEWANQVLSGSVIRLDEMMSTLAGGSAVTSYNGDCDTVLESDMVWLVRHYVDSFAYRV